MFTVAFTRRLAAPAKRRKPTLRGGLFCVAGAACLIATASSAQDYIDVESERQRGRQGSGQYNSEYQSQSQSQIGNQGAVSYGVGAAAAATGVTPATSTRTLPPPTAPSGDNIGGLFNQVQQLQQEVMRLNGLVEQQAYELRTLKEQSLERYMDIDRRLAGGAGTGAGAATAGVSAGGAASSAASAAGAPRPTGGAAEQPGEATAYQAAYALVRAQEFDNAVTAFKAFLDNYPAGRFAPNAHYWLGELYLVITPADPESARQSFMLLLNQYPDNSKVPDALYKLGRVQFMKGNSSAAREFLDRVIREYPSSSAARLAGDFIDQNL